MMPTTNEGYVESVSRQVQSLHVDVTAKEGMILVYEASAVNGLVCMGTTMVGPSGHETT